MIYAGHFWAAKYMKLLQLKTFERFELLLARLLAFTPARSYAFAMLARLKAEGAGLRGVDLERARICIRQGKSLEALEMLKEEVRLYPENWDAKKLLDNIRNSVPPAYSVVSEELAKVLPSILPYTMLSMKRLEALFLGAKNVCIDDLEGNFVECGVAAGGSSALLAWVIKKYSSRPRFVFCFDTFTGMPKPTIHDTHAGVGALQTGWGQGTCAAPMDSLHAIARILGVQEIIRPIKGLFQETLPVARKEIGAIGLLHLDGDWYDSTRCILENLYDQSVDGAYLQVDDYGHWQGCRKAIDEFENIRNLNFIRKTIDSSGICFPKPARS